MNKEMNFLSLSKTRQSFVEAAYYSLNLLEEYSDNEEYQYNLYIVKTLLFLTERELAYKNGIIIS